jgi:hypothetical protein
MLDAALSALTAAVGSSSSILPSATDLAAVTVAVALLEANTRPPLSVSVNITATTVTTAADVAKDTRYDPAINVDGSPSPAALDDDADDGGGRNHAGTGSRRVRHLKCCKIISACVF